MNLPLYQSLLQSGIVAIIRNIPASSLTPVLQALQEGGVSNVEITLNTPGALAMIAQAKKEFGSQMIIGAGTVLDAPSARAAIGQGADFVLSPTLDTEVIRVCNTYNKIAVPGVLTPTEALTAWQAGAPVLKIFPAGSFGPGYIKDLLGPLSQLCLMPVGGVTLENAAAFIRNGAAVLGVGSDLVDKKLAKEQNYSEITRRAKAFLEAVRQGRA